MGLPGGLWRGAKVGVDEETATPRGAASVRCPRITSRRTQDATWTVSGGLCTGSGRHSSYLGPGRSGDAQKSQDPGNCGGECQETLKSW